MAKQTALVCAKCGKPVDEGVKFCPSCGTAVQQAAPKETTEKKPVNCPKCGKPVDEGVKFCPSCGTAVTQASPKEATVIKPVNCTQCGTKLPDGVKFCPSCGASVADISPDAAEQQADPDDAEKNKGMALIAYILFFVPLITGDHRKSPFVKFHTNQGTVLFIVSTAVSIVWGILSAIFGAIFVGSLYRGSLSGLYGRATAASIFWPIWTVMGWVLVILILALLVIGILNTVKGRMKPLPVIGKFTIIK